MKKLLIILTFILGAMANSQAQISFGLNMNYMPHKNLNRIIDDYNQRRPWLTKELGGLNLLTGFNVGYSFGNENIRYSLMRLTWTRAQTQSAGIPIGATEMHYRDLRLRHLDISLIEIAAFAPIKDKKSMLGFGLSLDVAYLFVRTRTYTESTSDDDSMMNFETIFSTTGEFLNISTNFGFSPRIYYVPAYGSKARLELGFGPSLYIWNEIMPKTAQALGSDVNQHYKKFRMSPNHLALNITLSFY